MKDRINWWNNNHAASRQGDSPPLPFVKYVDMFKNKSLLEIGPGEGRQFDFVSLIAKEYSIADIAPVVLIHEKYNQCTYRILIDDYTNPNRTKVDAIHFWYMLHHVKRKEIPSFVNWLDNYLYDEGFLMFNTPFLNFHEGAYGNDGIQTTKMGIDEIEELFQVDLNLLLKIILYTKEVMDGL